MSRKRKRRVTDASPAEEAAAKRSAIIKLVTLIFVTAAVFGLYRVMMTLPYFEITLGIYMVSLLALIVAYMIYNRGMTRRGVTADMLPDEWSDGQKEEFIEDGKRRMKRSSWMLILIMAFLFTFAFDMLELWVLPFIDKALSK